MISKLDVLDSIMNLEDKYEAEMKDQIETKVTSDIISKYGELGKNVCAIYYKKDLETDDKKTDDCPDCEKKAKQLIKKLKLANSISESISNSDFENWFKTVSQKICLEGFNDIINDVRFELESNGIKTTDVLIRNLIIKLTVNFFSNIS